jgi:hypothetical protein
MTQALKRMLAVLQWLQPCVALQVTTLSTWLFPRLETSNTAELLVRTLAPVTEQES